MEVKIRWSWRVEGMELHRAGMGRGVGESILMVGIGEGGGQK